MTIFKPLLAGKLDLSLLAYPVIGSTKLDGIRCLAMGALPKSRSMKDIPNRHVQRLFAANAAVLEGLDGELIVGEPNAPDVYRVTNSAIMSHDGEPDFTFHVFDFWNRGDQPYHLRYHALAHDGIPRPSWVKIHPAISIDNQAALDSFEAQALADGYEGVMLRSRSGPYKQGRSSSKEGILLKVKRHEENEAEIIGVEEEMHNANEAQVNELGRTKRSSHQAGKVGKGTMGALHVRGVNGPFKGVEFHIGSGFTAAQRAEEWEIGSTVTYKHFPIGVKDKPRHPVFKGRRDARDMDAAA